MSDLSPGCLAGIPNLGEACGQPHLDCNYNVCVDDQIPPNQWAYGIRVHCEQSQWQFYSGNEARSRTGEVALGEM